MSSLSDAKSNANSRPYAYLRSHLTQPEDISTLEEIVELRRHIMRGRADAHGPSRRMHLHLHGLTITLDSETAPSSIDTLEEIFRDKAHAAKEGFDGTGAKTVVDLGANEGFYSLAMLLRNPSLNILAVEPIRRNFRLLSTNVRANMPFFAKLAGREGNTIGRVIPVQAAAADHCRGVDMETYPHVSTMSSRNIAALEQSWMDASAVEREHVPTTTLPELIRLLRNHGFDYVDILKIDVEGDECTVLESTRLDRVGRIVVEWHSETLRDRCISLLESADFTLVHAEAQRFGDLYFERPDLRGGGGGRGRGRGGGRQ